MRFEVPQFIEIEDKIFGPFTWKQFVYLGGGVGFAVVLLVTAPFYIFVLVGAPIAALAGALAYYPINNRPFSVFLESIFNFYKSRRFYYWRKKDVQTYRNATVAAPKTVATETGVKPSTEHGAIHSLSRKLELEALQQGK